MFRLDIDFQVSSLTGVLTFKLTPILKKCQFYLLIDELNLDERINDHLHDKTYYFLRNLKKQNTKKHIIELKIGYELDGDIRMSLMAGCFMRKRNLNFIKAHNFFL